MGCCPAKPRGNSRQANRYVKPFFSMCSCSPLHNLTPSQLAYTCYQMYAKTRSGLAPEYVQFSKSSGDDFSKGSAAYYILRPETAETFFILYHLTKDTIYRVSWFFPPRARVHLYSVVRSSRRPLNLFSRSKGVELGIVSSNRRTLQNRRCICIDSKR